jgi:hypothetical protein
MTGNRKDGIALALVNNKGAEEASGSSPTFS